MKKRIAALLLSTVMAFSLTACGNSAKTEKADNKETKQTTEAVEDMSFDEMVDAAKGTTVTFYGWGGDDSLNDWLDNYYAPRLKEKYDIEEDDFISAELEVVPAGAARDYGFDRSMIMGYGHDDRVDAYPALMAEIATKNPAFTTVCVLTDKEEIGSDGVTGMQSMYVFHFMQELCRTAGQDDIIAFRNSVCLSADVTAAYDPSWASAFEPMNGTYAGRGIALFKYTGSRGKSAANDASAELVGYVTRMMDADDVAWQIGELGRLDLGGGGTIAKYVANRGIPVIDIGVPVLSMHSPFEVIHKTDLYMAYRAFVLFNQAAE